MKNDEKTQQISRVKELVSLWQDGEIKFPAIVGVLSALIEMVEDDDGNLASILWEEWGALEEVNADMIEGRLADIPNEYKDMVQSKVISISKLLAGAV